MKFHAESHGDRSVGINGSGFVLELVGVTPDMVDGETRDYFKERLQAMMDDYDETGSIVWAEDECVDCGAMLGPDGQCSRPDCISNTPEY